MARKWGIIWINLMMLALLAAPAMAGFVDNGNGTVTDTFTGLTWQQATAPGIYDWGQAIAYCEDLTLGGRMDWRLPTRKELRSIVDYGRYSPAINTAYFSNSYSGSYWSSTIFAASTSHAWGIRFYSGVTMSNGKSGYYYVRAVRGGQSGSLGDLVIAQTPMTGPPGTTFVQWGTGFTPNSTAILHFQKPDGTEYPTEAQPIDSIGHFEISYTAPYEKPSGTYTWWAVDGVTGKMSNTVAYTVTGSTDSSISGQVAAKDSHGNVQNPLSGASVQITGGGSAVSDSQGNFYFAGLASGTYSLTANKAGFYPETRQIVLNSGDTKHEIVYLTQQSTTAPSAYDFESPQGNHFIEGMPGDLQFATTVAWNGSPGSVRFRVAGQWVNASTTDLGGGMARADLTIAAPTAISSCSELTIEIINGEGESKYINMGVHFSPITGAIPWYPDNIAWTPSGAALSSSESLSYDFDLPLPSDSFDLGAYFEFERQIKYNLLAATFKGSLKGEGGLEFKIPTPQPGLKILGGAGLGMEGALAMSLARCETPSMTSSWTLSFNGKAGIEAPVVLAVDAIAPGVGSSLATVPLIKDIKLKLFQKAGGSLSGEYKNGKTGDCFLGATSLSGSVSGGPEAVALVEIKKLKAEAGVYVGGNGAWDFGICPDFGFDGYTGRMYAGAFAQLYGFEYKKEVGAEIQWDFTGNKAAQILSMSNFSKTPTDTAWQPIGKAPLKWGDTNRLSDNGDKRLMQLDAALAASGPVEDSLVENMIGLASPSVFSDADDSIILYVHHDTDKPWYAATDIGSVYQEGLAPWAMERLTDDLAAEFSPDIEQVDADTLLAAWTRAEGDISGAKAPEDIVFHLEIVSSWYDMTSGTWDAPVQLTTNNFVDRNPLSVMFGETQGVIWIQNQGPAMIGDATSGDSLMYREWTGTDWAAPQTLWAGLKGILEFSFAADDQGQGQVVLSVDQDGDLETTVDRELYRVSTFSGLWQAAIRLTDNSEEDSLPVLVAPDNLPMLIWKAGETLKYSALDIWNPVDVYIKDTLANEAPTLDAATMPGGAVVAYTVQGPDGIDIVAAFYDAALDQWSLPRQLTHDEDAESSLALDFDEDELVMAYLKTQTLREDMDIEIDGQIQPIENVPQPGRTDLYVLRHTLGNDLAVDGESILVSPENPAPETVAEVQVSVENNGDLPVQDIIVTLYDGDPNSGGMYINETVIAGPVVAGDQATANISWNIPSEMTSHHLYVVVDPDLVVDDRDRTNNTASIWTSMPDVRVETAWNNPVSSSTVALTARLVNEGVNPAGSFDVSWRLFDENGPEIGKTTVASMIPGTTNEVTCLWNVAAPIQPGQFMPVYVVVDTENTVPEFDETNNTFQQSVKTPIYTDQAGTLTVNILPPEAVADGLKWSPDGGLNWYDSGTALTLLSGIYSVTFSEVDVWKLSAIDNIIVQPGEAIVIVGRELPGDINADGAVDINDAIAALQIITGIYKSAYTLASDVNNDDKIGMEEVVFVIEKVAGLR